MIRNNFFQFKRLQSSAWLLLLLGSIILLSSCTSVRVSQDYDLSYPLGLADSFGWNTLLQQENDRQFNHDELQAERFQVAIERVLTQQGLRHTENPKLLVSYSYSVSSRIQSDPVNTRFIFGFGSSYWRHGYHHGIGFDTGGTIYQYYEGKLVLALHSAETGKLVWKGTGTREASTHATPSQLTRRINELVETVLKQFPPLNQPRAN